MTREIISTILEAEGAKSSPKGLTLAESREVTCFISTAGDVLPVGRVTRIELRDKYLCLETAKDERFFFAYEDVLGFKAGGAGASKELRSGVGFGR